jgi:DNA-binding NtrC family response regulator
MTSRRFESGVPPPLAGSSPAVTRARAAFEHAAASAAPVLIVAEEGLEPEAIARALHARTRRSERFRVVPCTAGDPADIERQLCGRIARRAADHDLLSADAVLVDVGGGTVFLSGVEELPASAQRRLARVLRDGEVRIGGGRGPVALRARVVAAARPGLETELRDGAFRADLHRRLASQVIDVPRLRDRAADLPAVIERVVADGRSNGSRPAFTQAALTVLSALPWPRNLEDLRTVLERILAVAGDRLIRQEDVLACLPIEGAFARMTSHVSLREARRQFEREYIAQVLEHHRWRMSDAARTLGIERANLYRKTRQLGIVHAARGERS